MAGIVALAPPGAAIGAVAVPQTGSGPVVAPSGGAGPDLTPWALLLAAMIVVWVLWTWDIIRPGSFVRLAERSAVGRARGRNPAALGPGAWIVAAFAVLAAQVVGFGAVSGLSPGVLGAEGSLRREALTSGAAIGLGALVGVLLVSMLRTVAGPGAGLEWGAGGVKRLGKSLAAGAAGLALVLPLCHGAAAISAKFAEWFTGVAPDRIAHSTLGKLLDDSADPWRLAVIAVVVVGAPLAEELLYRMGLQSSLASLMARVVRGGRAPPPATSSGPSAAAMDSGSGRWTAVLAASAAFALVHTIFGGPVPWYALPPLMVLAVGLGVAYERSGRLLVPVFMHAGFNAWNILLAVSLSGN